MNKFTIFSVILAVCLVTVTLDLAVRDFLVKTGQASVFGSEVSPVLGEETDAPTLPGDEKSGLLSSEKSSVKSPVSSEGTPEVTVTPPPATLPEIAPPKSFITGKIITQSGFGGSAVLTEKHFEGKVFQLLDITKIPVDAINFHEVAIDGVAVTSVTEIVLRDEMRALQLYILLQNKTKPYIDLKLNETNAYGDRSFYINHEKKPDEAFLVVKIGQRIYTFAYVKTYHPQMKALIALLTNL